MKMSPELKAVKNAYMKARSENDSVEMNRLKTKAMAIKNKDESEADTHKVPMNQHSRNSTYVKSKDGDSLEISQSGQNLTS